MIVFSGIRPTADIHLGNYLGAIRQWVTLTKTHPESSFFFSIVDQHALTTHEERSSLPKDVLTMAATYLACGLDPDRHTIFVQSDVPYHTELAWYLGCLTPLGWLNRMTQFKDKSKEKPDRIVSGLYTYPILMAADILLYQSTHVPVGEDQKQHVEFTRDLAISINQTFGINVLTCPEPLIPEDTFRIMSLRDGSKKMSKSDLSEHSRIHLTDSTDAIVQKIRKAKTDPHLLPDSQEGLGGRPEAKNLLLLHSALTETPLKDTVATFAGSPFLTLKASLTDVLTEFMDPLRTKIMDYLKDPSGLKRVLSEGAEKAQAVSQPTLNQVRYQMGVRS